MTVARPGKRGYAIGSYASEINEHRIPPITGFEHHILGLDVTVIDPSIVEALDCARHNEERFRGLGYTGSAAPELRTKGRCSVHQLIYDVCKAKRITRGPFLRAIPPPVYTNYRPIFDILKG